MSNIGTIIFGFVALCIVAAGLVFIAANSSVDVTDTYGNTYSESANRTNDMLTTVTDAGTNATGLGLLVLMGLGAIAAVGMIVVYSKK